jgi:hypothetical protein
VELNFEDAVIHFKDFLLRNNFSGEIIWITPKDVLLSGDGRIYIKSPVHQRNESYVRNLFQAAVAYGRGILLAALCEMDQKTLCYAWVPASASEAEQRLVPGGLKMSVPSDRRVRAFPVANRLIWLYLSFRYRRAQQAKNELFR